MRDENREYYSQSRTSRHLFVLHDLRTVWSVWGAAWRLMPDTWSTPTPFHPEADVQLDTYDVLCSIVVHFVVCTFYHSYKRLIVEYPSVNWAALDP